MKLYKKRPCLSRLSKRRMHNISGTAKSIELKLSRYVKEGVELN